MSKATLGLSPAVTVSKPDRAADVRRVWRAAYSQARRLSLPRWCGRGRKVGHAAPAICS